MENILKLMLLEVHVLQGFLANLRMARLMVAGFLPRWSSSPATVLHVWATVFLSLMAVWRSETVNMCGTVFHGLCHVISGTHVSQGTVASSVIYGFLLLLQLEMFLFLDF